jgi:hypothetical protein
MMPRHEPDSGHRIAAKAVRGEGVSEVVWLPAEGREPEDSDPMSARSIVWWPAIPRRNITFRSVRTPEAPVHTELKRHIGHSNPITARCRRWRQAAFRHYPAFRSANPNTDRSVAV